MDRQSNQRPTHSMSRSQEQLDKLMRTAARRQEPLPRRTASVRNLHSALRTPQGQAAGQAMLSALWPAALQLLQDSQADMRQAVAPVVGFLGALAARPGRPAGVSPNLLFEWAMPVLAGQGIAGWVQLDVGAKCWVLVALKECMAAVDLPVLHQHALAVLTLCVNLLGSDSTSVHLIAPVLGLVTEASRHPPSLRTKFKELVDLLIAWWLEPSLDDIVRPLLARTMDSLEQGWGSHPGYGYVVLGNLVQDLNVMVKDESGVNSDKQKGFSRLCNCMDAVLVKYGRVSEDDLLGASAEWVQGMHTCYQKGYVAPAQAPPQAASTIEQFCLYMQHAITAIMTPIQRSLMIELWQSARSRIQQLRVQETQPDGTDSKQSAPAYPLQPLAKPAFELLAELAGWAKRIQKPKAALCILKVVQSFADAMQQPGGQASAAEMDLLLGDAQPITQLRSLSDPQIANQVVILKSSLLMGSATREPAAQHVIRKMLQSLASTNVNAAGQADPAYTSEQTVSHVQNSEETQSHHAQDGEDQSSWSVHVRGEVADLQQAVTKHQDPAVCLIIWQKLVHLAEPGGPLDTAPDVWPALLTLLHEVWHHTDAVSTHELATLLLKLTRLPSASGGHDLGVQWASDAALQSCSPANEAGTALEDSFEDSFKPPIQQVAQQEALDTPMQCPDEYLEVLLRFCRASDPKVRLSATQALLKIARSASHLRPHQLVAMANAACHSLTDSAELVSQASIQLLSALAAPTSHAILSAAVQTAHYEPPWRQAYALQPQQIAFHPEQLAELFGWLRQGTTLIVSQPIKSGGSAVASDEWLQALLKGCQTLHPSVNLPLTSGAAAWFAVQEAAKQCTAVRMRTHLGNPSQTFAALEQMLQSMLYKLAVAGPDPSQTPTTDSPAPVPQLYSVPASRSNSGAPLLEPAWMLLELMHALEKNMYSAYGGSCLQGIPFSSSAVAFYKSNRKVCEDWFTRMRLLLLRTSAAAKSPHLTLHHAFARLNDLKTQLRHLQAAAAAEAAQQKQLLAEQKQAEVRQAEAQAAEQQDSTRSPTKLAVTEDGSSSHASAVQQADVQQQQSQSGIPAQPLSRTHLPNLLLSQPQASTGLSIQQRQQQQQQQQPPFSAYNAGPQQQSASASGAVRPVSLAASKPAPVGLLEIQAEQEAESLRAAKAVAGAASTGRAPSRTGGNQAHPPSAGTTPQKSQARVLQVKRQKPGQPPLGIQAPKVVPLTKVPSGKVVVAQPAPAPGKVKLMARPKTASEESPSSATSAIPQASSDRASSMPQPTSPPPAFKARAQVAKRISAEVQEVVRHAALALLSVADADAILGLQRYCQRTFATLKQLADAFQGGKGSSSDGQDEDEALQGAQRAAAHLTSGGHQYDWLQAVALQAASRHEAAAIAYNKHLGHSDGKHGTLDADSEVFLVERCCEAYAAVADWQGLQQWLQDVKGQKHTTNGKNAGWPLTPAQEHKFDALAALDAGQLAEAQHAFDLSVWSDLKTDKDGIHAAEAAEATALKALMQLHAPSTVKQRASRDKRLIRSMLQDSKDALLQSLSITAQTGLQNTAAQLTALHCITAVQDTVPPPPTATLPAADAPPGFAPKTIEPASADAEVSFALKLWPFSSSNSNGFQQRQWPQQDAQTLLQLLRVHRVIASEDKQAVPQQLLLDTAHSAVSSGNHAFAGRLIRDSLLTTPDHDACIFLRLLKLQQHHKLGNFATSAAAEQLWKAISPTPPSATASHTQQPAVLQAQALLQLAEWCAAAGKTAQGVPKAGSNSAMSDAWHSEVVRWAKKQDTNGGPQVSLLPAVSPEAACLAAAVTAASGFAPAWLAYANYLHTLCQPASTAEVQLTVTEGQHPTDAASLPSNPATAVPLQDNTQICVEMIKAYCTYLRLAAHSLGQAGMPEDQLPVLLKLLQILSRPELDPTAHTASEEQRLSREELQALLSGLKTVPMTMWRAVVSQLFALLAHSQEDVARLAGELLQGLQMLDPAAVLFPALVESKRISSGQFTTKPALEALLSSCRARQPQLVEQAELMMAELEDMSVLWLEQWHIALLELQADVSKRVGLLQNELKLIKEKPGMNLAQQNKLMQSRYTTIFAPAVHALQQRLKLNASQAARLPHQQDFVQKHLPALQQAAAALAYPSAEVLAHPELAWNAFKAVSKAIAQQLSSREVEMKLLSPVLSQLAASPIPIPGLTPLTPAQASKAPCSHKLASTASDAEQALPYQISSAEMVTVAGFKQSVHVMSTKTRPKRIGMIGSDGRTYTFLLKGWEDLRLDERLMQLVRAFSSTLSSDPDTARRQLLPCPLSVTPVGSSMGLIQWLDHTMPLYGVYKAWQHRQMADKAEAAKPQVGPDQTPSKGIPAHPMRASDAFYAKLLPALEAAGLPRSTARKDWPLSILKQILPELIQETPRQLLARELWCGTGSASEWWSFQAGYTSSTAATSMVGYLLGLGDRHLDNILLDKQTGRVVHIDYNIVFDKGKQLRVPEIVPFRLTHTLQAALGATGVEGSFRIGCEQIIRVARQHSTTLNALLQSILLDPLVSWASDRQQASTKKDADAAVALSLFCSRVSEYRQSCCDCLSALAAALPAAVSTLQAYEAVHTVAAQLASAARAAHQLVLQSQASQAAAASGEQSFTLRLKQAQAASQQSTLELQSNTHFLQRHLRECQGWADRHQYTVKAVRDHTPPELLYPDSRWAVEQAPVPLGLVVSLGPSSLPSMVQAALQSTQQHITFPQALLHQAHSLDQQGAQLLAHRGQGILAGLAGLQAYSAAHRLVLGQGYADSSHHNQWAGAIESAAGSDKAEVINAAIQLAPMVTSPHNAASNWHALRLLPSTVEAVRQHVSQQAVQLQTGKQSLVLDAADAKAELCSCLDQLEDQAQADSVAAQAMQHCLHSIHNELVAMATVSQASTHVNGLSQLRQHVTEHTEAVSSMQWVSEFQHFLSTYAQMQQHFMSDILPYLLASEATGLGPSAIQQLGVIRALQEEIGHVEGAVLQLRKEQLEHADLLASDVDRAATQSDPASPGTAATDTAVVELGQPTSASDIRESVTAGLRDRAEAIQAHKQALIIQIQPALSTVRHSSAFSQPQDVDQLFQTAVGKFAELLQSLTDSAQQLPEDASSSGSTAWDTAAFKVNTIYAVLATCFNASADATAYSTDVGADVHADSDVLDRCLLLLSSSFEAATEAWTHANVLPRLLHQLKATSADSTVETEQDERGLANGNTDALLQDLDSLSLQDAALTTDLPRPNARQGQSADLVPCNIDDVDCLLEATGETLEWPPESVDQTLESGLQSADQTLESGLETDADSQQADLFTAKGELVPYSGFDEALAGADETLEDLSESPKDSASISICADNSGSDQGDEAQQAGSSQSERLSSAVLQYLHCAGAVATAEQQEAAVAAAQADLNSKAEVLQTGQLLVAFEWVHEPELVKGLQEGLGQPLTISPKDPRAEPNWSLSIRRSQVLHALESCLAVLSGAEDAYLAWRQASAQTEAQLHRLLASGRQHSAALDQLFNGRRQWLNGCDDMAGWVERTAQGVLQLERSREGLMWSQASGIDETAFADCQALLQQRQYLASTVESTQLEVTLAQQELPQLQQQASQAAAQLGPAQAEEKRLGQRFAQQAPKLVQAAEALLQPVKDCQAAALASQPTLEQTQAALHAVLPQLQGSNAAQAMRDSLKSTHSMLVSSHQHAVSVEKLHAQMTSAIEASLYGNPNMQQCPAPGKKPNKGVSKSKRAALVLDAMQPLLTTALEQAQSPGMAAPQLQDLADAVKVLPQQAKAVADGIQQAYQTTGLQPVGTALASEADAQPDPSEATSSLPPPTQTPAAADMPDANVTGSSSQSDQAALAQAPRDDLEQDSKAGLKAGVQADVLKDGAVSVGNQTQNEEAVRAQRLAFARATLDSFNWKLSGQDIEGKAECDVQEHVDCLIKQATSMENLCQMYEGWTAWI